MSCPVCGKPEWEKVGHPPFASTVSHLACVLQIRDDTMKVVTELALWKSYAASVDEALKNVTESAQALSAELAALKARRCEGCAYQEHWPKEGPSRLSEMPLACTSCFGTSRWTAEEATS